MQSQLARHALDPPSVPLAGLQQTPKSTEAKSNGQRSFKAGSAMLMRRAVLPGASQIWDMAQPGRAVADQISIVEVAERVLQHELI